MVEGIFASQLLAVVVKHELISSNPLKDLKSGAGENPSRYQFVTGQEVERVPDACSVVEWPLLFVLSP